MTEETPESVITDIAQNGNPPAPGDYVGVGISHVSAPHGEYIVDEITGLVAKVKAAVKKAATKSKK